MMATVPGRHFETDTKYGVRMRRLLRLPSGATFTILAVAIYTVVRALSSIGRPVASFPDTIGYETLSYMGRNDRFWPVPLAFHIAHSPGARVALQVVVGVIAWSWLAAVLSRESRVPRTITAVVLAVGLVPQVVRYDLALLSESLSISFAVGAVAATMMVAQRPSITSRLAWFGAVSLCAMTRPTHLIVLVACLSGATFLAVSSRGRRMVVPALVLVSVSAWGWSLYSGNQRTGELNMYTVLAERIVTNDARYEWFIGHGMPDVPGVRSAEGYDFAGQLPAELAAFVQLPVGQQPPAIIRAGGLDLARWVRDDGWRTYARFVATHPADTWSRIASLTPSVLDPPNDDFLPLEPRSLVPRLLFRTWWLWAVAGIAATAAGLARPGGARVARAIVAMSVTAALVHSANLLTSGIEHPRHSATVAVIVRVLALCAVANVATSAPEVVGRRRARPDDQLV